MLRQEPILLCIIIISMLRYQAGITRVAFHSVDLWFFFETLAKCWRPFVGKHYDLARQMCNYWANFIKNGDPNGIDITGEEQPYWAPYTAEEPYGMLFGDKPEFLREKPDELMEFLVDQYFKRRV